MNFPISGFLDFCLYLGNEMSYQRSAGVKTTGFARAFWIFQKNVKFFISGFVDFWIFFGFLAISWQRKELPEIRSCQNNQIFEGLEFLDFLISGFLDLSNFFFGYVNNFFGISGYILATERAIRVPLVSKRSDF